MNGRYQKGYRFECQVRGDLNRRGYYVIRAAGSKSKVDIVAVKHNIALFIQCKADGNISPAEWNTLYSICQAPNLLPVVARKKRGRPEYLLLLRQRGGGRREWEPLDPGEVV